MKAAAVITAVVPTRNSGRTLASCLDSLRAQTAPGIRIVVVDNASHDETVNIALARADDVMHAGPERSAQRNIGWRGCGTRYVAFIDSDMVLEPDVLAQSVALLDSDPAMGGVVVGENAFGVGFLASCRVLEKQLYAGDERVEALRVVRREILESLGGYDETLTAFEDWELHDRIVAAGCGVGRVNAVIWHDEGQLSLGSAFSKKRYYGRWLRVARARRLLTRPLASRIFVKRPGLLLRAPLRACGLVVLKCVECAGMFAGALASGPTRRTSS